MTYTPPAVPYFGPVVHFSQGNNLPPTRIVIHCTAGPGQTCAVGAQGTARYFQDPKSGGSAHYITDIDETIQCAYDNVICWHAPPNPHSIGIEMECSLAGDGQGHWGRQDHITMMHRTAKLVAQKCLQYGIPTVKLSVADLQAGKHGVTGHADVSKAFQQSDHTDPGSYFPWAQFMVWVQEEAAAITAPTLPKVPDMTPEQALMLARIEKKLDTLILQESGRYQRDEEWNKQILDASLNDDQHLPPKA